MANLFSGNTILALIAQLRAVFVGRDELVTGTAITNLNADMVDGLHAGNAINNVALNNSTLNTNLNADMVDGLHAATSGANAHVLATDASGSITVDGIIRANSSSGSNSEYTSVTIWSLVNNATAPIPISSSAMGLLLAIDTSNPSSGMFHVARPMAYISIVSNTGLYSIIAGTVGKINIYNAAGVLTVENKTGGTTSIKCTFLGYGT